MKDLEPWIGRCNQHKIDNAVLKRVIDAQFHKASSTSRLKIQEAASDVALHADMSLVLVVILAQMSALPNLFTSL